MEGGFFLVQRIDFRNAKGIEIIGYDEESGSIRSHYFGNAGGILEYTYDVDDDTIMVTIDMPHVQGRFVGEFADDGNSYTGRWEWTQDGAKLGYDATMTRG
jgi:hypothetical protein